MYAKALLVLAVAIGAARAEDKKEAAKFDHEKMLGKWKLVEGKKAGGALGDEAKKGHYEITKDKITLMDEAGKAMFVFDYTVDAKASPVTIDMKISKSPDNAFNDAKAKGIVELDGDSLKLCYNPMGEDRPTKMDGEKFYWFSLKREKKEEKK